MPDCARHDNSNLQCAAALISGGAAMNRERHFWVYIMSSKSRRIYTSMTNDIQRRVAEHKAGEIEGFTQRYRINRLVYFERFHYVGNAIEREKGIKGLDRAKRDALIESMNPIWDDLSEEWGKPIEPVKRIAKGKKGDASLRSS